MERYETAFYSPMVSDWRNFETWEEAGSVDATMRANKIWKQLVDEYEQPPLDRRHRRRTDRLRRPPQGTSGARLTRLTTIGVRHRVVS